MNTLKLFVVMMVATSFLAAQDYNITGAGARAEGFGGAYIGLADDATAVVWNPAGLSQLEKTEASIVTRFVSEGLESNKLLTNTTDNLSQGHFALNFMSFAFPMHIGETNIVAAIAFQQQLNFYQNYKSVNKGVDNFQNVFYQEDYSINSKGGVNTITPAISFKITSAFFIGLSANIWTGSVDSKEKIDNSSIILYRGQNTYDESSKYSGVNFVFGGLYDFERTKNGFPLKIGTTVRTPFILKSEGDWTVSEQFPELLRDYGYFINDKFSLTKEIQMPLMFGLGGSYRFGDNLTIALDYESRNYGDKTIKESLVGQNLGKVDDLSWNLSQSKENLKEIRMGGEYLIVLARSVIPIRLGYKTGGTLYANIDSRSGVSQVVSKGLSIGSGYITDSYALDITISSTSFTQDVFTLIENKYTIGVLSTSLIFYF